MNIHTFEITCKLSGYRYKKIHRDLMACGSDYYKNKCKALRDKGIMITLIKRELDDGFQFILVYRINPTRMKKDNGENYIDLYNSNYSGEIINMANEIISGLSSHLPCIEECSLSRVDFCVNIRMKKEKQIKQCIKLLNQSFNQNDKYTQKTVGYKKAYPKEEATFTNSKRVQVSIYNKQLQLEKENLHYEHRMDILRVEVRCYKKYINDLYTKFKIKSISDFFDDLFQVGCLGLVKAIDNFNTSYDVKLSTYACPMIEGEIKRYLRDNNTLRISRSIKDLAYKTLKLKEELSVGGKEPTNKEIAEKLKVTEYEISVALDSLKEPVSMYEPIYNDGGDTIYLYDQIAVKEDEYGLDNRLALDRAMKNLKKRELNILKDRFIVGKTQMEIAEELGISQAQISRIEKNAINTIKKNIK